MTRIGLLAVASCMAVSGFAQQNPAAEGVPVTVITTVESHTPRQLTQDDILVSKDKRHMQVTGFAPLHDHAALQLWLLIDDGSATSLGNQLMDLREFVRQQPSSTEVGIGYMRNGSVAVIQPLTTDHEQAAKAMRLPIGTPGISASPYLALIDLIHKWPAATAAREVLMVSSGIDPDYGVGPDNPYLTRAIDVSQRAGIVVYSIYFPGAGYVGRANWRITWGQNDLSRLSQETGGEFYWQGDRAPVSLTPYLDSLNHRLNEQYLLTFLAEPEKKPGFQTIKLATEIPHVSLAGPAKVYVEPQSF